MINVYLHSTSGPSAWQLSSFPAVLYHTVNWLAGSDFAARAEGKQPSGFLSLLPCLSLPLCKHFASAPLSCELQRLSRCLCVSVCHTSRQTQVRTHPFLAAGARALKVSYHHGAHVLGCGCICKGRKEAVGSLQEKTAPRSPGPCPLCLDEISDATGCLVSNFFL